MKKIVIIAIAVVVLVACLIIAHKADQNTKVPASTPATPAMGNTTTTTANDSIPSTPAPPPSDIENGLGWG